MSAQNRLRAIFRDDRLAAGLIAGLLLVSCAPSKVTIDRSPDLPKYRISTVAIVPFETLSTPQTVHSDQPAFWVPPGARRSDINVTVPPSPEQAASEVARVPPEVGEKVTRMFYEKLRHRDVPSVVSPEEARRAMAELKKESGTAGSEELSPKLARKVKADAALTGRVLVWQERGGSKWGGEPATVGFEVKLLAPDGTTLWTGNYYERQRPMIEDFVGWLERRGVFVTADELAEYGVAKLLKKFPSP